MTDNNTKLNHLAIIPDGNRRWAKNNKLPQLEGHRRGFQRITEIARHLRQINISTFTVWGFSTENWGRPETEIHYLMEMFLKSDAFLKEFIKDEVKVTHLGRKDRLPKKVVDIINTIEEKTKTFTRFYLNIAIDYGGHDEIIRAANKHMKKYPNDPFSEANFETCLDTAHQPYPRPDLVVRSGGEKRLSGFFSWAIAYSELTFIDTLLPDVTTDVIDTLISDFYSRQRRFGK